MDASRKEHLIPGKEIHLTDMRGVHRFCEVGLITGTSKGNAIANFYNSTGSSRPYAGRSSTPSTPRRSRRRPMSRKVFLNPVRHWTFDEFWCYEDGVDRTFGDIKMHLDGGCGASKQLEKAVTKGQLCPRLHLSGFAVQFNKGSEIYMLDAPDGEVFVMQSFTDAVQKEVDINHIKDLGNKLHLPQGWKFRSVVLDQDLIVNQKRANNLAHVFQDDMKDAYQGSDGGKAFNFVP